MSQRTLYASINGRSVGTLIDASGGWEFVYDDHWLAFEQRFALSPHLPLQAEPLVDGSSERHVQWYFDNLLPEEGQRTLLADDANIHQADAFALLTHYGAESAGALTLLPEADAALAVSDVDGREDLSDADLEMRIANLPNVSLAHTANKRMSLAGGQHKLAVIYDNSQLFEPTGNAASTHILKPNHPSASFAQSVINEWFVMQLAAKVGISVPKVYRRYVPSSVYLIERFDRIHSEQAVSRSHSIDACQLLGMDAAFKYQQGSVGRLAEIAKFCRSSAQARTRLFNWLVFNVLIGNTDAHLKNLSFMVGYEGIELAPSYDLLSTAVYETPAFDGNSWPERTTMAWPLPGANFVKDINREVLVNAANELGLNKSTAERLIQVQLTRITPAANELYNAMLIENDRLVKDNKEIGDQVEAENRCVRCIIHNVLETTVQQIQS